MEISLKVLSYFAPAVYELNPHKMITPQEKAQCVSWFLETKSNVQTLLTSY